MGNCCISVSLYDGGAAAVFIWCSLLAMTRCYPGIPSSVAAQCPLSAKANKEVLCVTCTVSPIQNPTMLLCASAEQRK